MAQWNGQYSGLTHETKVKDIETSLRAAIAAFDAAAETERATKAKAVRHLAERLFSARAKALSARLSALRRPAAEGVVPSGLARLQTREKEVNEHGVVGILHEFRFNEPPDVDRHGSP
jgi:hypothetical protein